jgi:hypothetical protein
MIAPSFAAHYRKPWPFLAGVLCATLANHAAAGLIDAHLGRFLTPALLDSTGLFLILGAVFIGRAFDAGGVPDQPRPPPIARPYGRHSNIQLGTFSVSVDHLHR